MTAEAGFAICWDLGDVIFSEDTEVKSANGVTQHVVLVPGIGEIIRRLFARGIPMAIVSDTQIGSCENVLNLHGLTGCFAHWTISAALGVEKPHKSMFTSASNALGLPPERIAMVGNNYKRDVEGACNAGMTAIWFHWNERYPAPASTPAAHYVAHDAAGLSEVIDDWIASLDAPVRPAGDTA
jgi:HAD superfamily hydrolase (TIGR01549 family)